MRAVVLLSGGLDSYTAAAIAKAQRFTLFALTIALRPAPRARSRGGARGGARAGRRAASRARGRPARDRRVVAHLGRCRAARSRSARPATFRRPTCRRATRFFSRSRSAGPKCSARATSSSASTRSTIPAIPTAVRSSSRAFERLAESGDAGRRRGRPIPRAHAAADARQGGHHPARARARPRLRADPQLLRSVARRTALRRVRQLRAARQRLSRSRRPRPAPPGLESRELLAHPQRPADSASGCRDHVRAAGAVHRWPRGGLPTGRGSSTRTSCAIRRRRWR